MEIKMLENGNFYNEAYFQYSTYLSRPAYGLMIHFYWQEIWRLSWIYKIYVRMVLIRRHELIVAIIKLILFWRRFGHFCCVPRPGLQSNKNNILYTKAIHYTTLYVNNTYIKQKPSTYRREITPLSKNWCCAQDLYISALLILSEDFLS